MPKRNDIKTILIVGAGAQLLHRGDGAHEIPELAS